MAFSKMVGFEVTPRRSSSSIFFCRSPVVIIARRMLSYQMDWPSFIISVRRLLISHLPDRTLGGLRAPPVSGPVGRENAFQTRQWKWRDTNTVARGRPNQCFGLELSATPE